MPGVVDSQGIYDLGRLLEGLDPCLNAFIPSWRTFCGADILALEGKMAQNDAVYLFLETRRTLCFASPMFWIMGSKVCAI